MIPSSGTKFPKMPRTHPQSATVRQGSASGSKCGKLKEVEKGTLIPGWSSEARLNLGGADLSFLLSCPGSVAWVEAALAKNSEHQSLGDWDQFFFFSLGMCVIVPSPTAADLASGYWVAGAGTWGWRGGGGWPPCIYTQPFSSGM